MIRFGETGYLCFIFMSDLSVLLRLFWLEMNKCHRKLQGGAGAPLGYKVETQSQLFIEVGTKAPKIGVENI